MDWKVLCLVGGTALWANPLTLEEALKKAGANSESMNILKEQRQASNELVREVGSVVYPKVEITASAVVGQSPLGIKTGGGGGGGPLPDTLAPEAKQAVNYMGQSLAGAFQFDNDPRSNYRWSVGITQPLYTFGKLRTAIEVAEYQDSVVVNQYRRGWQEVQQGVVQSYAQLVLAQRNLQIWENSYKRQKEMRDFVLRNFSLGSGNRSDVLRSEAGLIQLEARKAALEAQKKMAVQQLNTLLGQDPSTVIVADTSLPRLAITSNANTSEAAQSLYDQALAKRGDMRALDLQRKIYAGGEKIDRAGYLPSIAATAKFGITAYDEVQGIYDLENKDWSVGVGLNWTLFDGFANSAKANQKKAESRILEAKRRDLVRQTQSQITYLLASAEVEQKNAEAAKRSYEALRETHHLLSADFRSGKGLFGDLLEVEESLTQTEMALFAARWQEWTVRAQLMSQTGDDLVNGVNP